MNREGELFEKTFSRPSDYFYLPAEKQWIIDHDLGIKDWFGGCQHKKDLNDCDMCWIRFKNHYNKNL